MKFGANEKVGANVTLPVISGVMLADEILIGMIKEAVLEGVSLIDAVFDGEAPGERDGVGDADTVDVIEEESVADNVKDKVAEND